MDFVPLSRITWPRARTTDRRNSQFKARYEDTIMLLYRELSNVGASRATLYAGMGQRDVRLDGFPRSDARATDQGVMLTFDTRGGPVQFACDTFFDWKSNLRAIALTLEHLRTVERYGATRPGQQYEGYRPELPASREQIESVEDAARFLSEHSSVPANSLLDFKASCQTAYRIAAAKLHPDVGGSNAEFVRLQQAMELLKAHHG